LTVQTILKDAHRAGPRVGDVHRARRLVDGQVPGSLSDWDAGPFPARLAVDHADAPRPPVGGIDAVALAPQPHPHRGALDGECLHDLLAVQINDGHRADQRVRDVRTPSRRVYSDLARRVVELDLADRLVRLPVDHRHRSVSEVDAVDAVPYRVGAEAP